MSGGAVADSQISKVSTVTSSSYRSKLESRFAERLELEKRTGVIKDWRYEPASLTLGLYADQHGKIKRKRFRPDFLVWTEMGIEFVEVKGRWIKNKRDGMTRLHWAAKDYPMFIWRVVWWKDGGWDGQYIVT